MFVGRGSRRSNKPTITRVPSVPVNAPCKCPSLLTLRTGSCQSAPPKTCCQSSSLSRFPDQNNNFLITTTFHKIPRVDLPSEHLTTHPVVPDTCIRIRSTSRRIALPAQATGLFPNPICDRTLPRTRSAVPCVRFLESIHTPVQEASTRRRYGWKVSYITKYYKMGGFCLWCLIPVNKRRHKGPLFAFRR